MAVKHVAANTKLFSQLRPILSRLSAYPKPLDGDAASFKFEKTIQDPKGPDWLLEELQQAAYGDSLSVREFDAGGSLVLSGRLLAALTAP